MSERIKWFSVALVLLGVVIGTQYVRAAAHYGTVATMSISPGDLTRAAKDLPVTVVDSYF